MNIINKNQLSGLFSIAGKLVIFYVITCCLASCLGPKKINKWVSEQYGGTLPAQTKKKSEYITISSAIAPTGDKLSTTEKNTSHVLPLIFYWQFDYKNTCTLNPQIAINNFTATVLSYAGKGLKQKLNGQHIELTIEQVPNTFAIDDKGHVIWIIYAFSWDILTIQPENKDIVVSYRVLSENNEEVKKGRITIPDNDKELALKMLQSLKKRTWQYLEQYDANITSMSKKFVDKLITEL